MILGVRTLGDPILRRVGDGVDRVTPELVRLAEDMLETMYAERGVGLAAPQVGVSLRLIVADPGPAEGGGKSRRLVYFNPVLSDLSGRDVMEEGCLSVPGVRTEVERATALRLRAMDVDGRPVDTDVGGYLCRILQHETDHTNGILFVDRVSAVQKTLLASRLREMEKANRKARTEAAAAS